MADAHIRRRARNGVRSMRLVRCGFMGLTGPSSLDSPGSSPLRHGSVTAASPSADQTPVTPVADPILSEHEALAALRVTADHHDRRTVRRSTGAGDASTPSPRSHARRPRRGCLERPEPLRRLDRAGRGRASRQRRRLLARVGARRCRGFADTVPRRVRSGRNARVDRRRHARAVGERGARPVRRCESRLPRCARRARGDRLVVRLRSRRPVTCRCGCSRTTRCGTAGSTNATSCSHSA